MEITLFKSTAVIHHPLGKRFLQTDLTENVITYTIKSMELTCLPPGTNMPVISRKRSLQTEEEELELREEFQPVAVSTPNVSMSHSLQLSCPSV